MASAFISYAHEDQEFVLALVEHLQTQGLEVRYDRVALRVGDSLIRALSREISEGDFLIAVVSPDSLQSEWCQTELSLARTQGIRERRIKVLPVRFRGAGMPPMLQDLYWADADADDVETISRRIAAAIRAELEGLETDAAREAAEAEHGAGEPAHEEVPGDLGVGRIDDVAERVWDVLAQWERCRNGGPTAELTDRQRRLRWALDGLPDHVRRGLPLVEQLSNSDWGDYFRVADPATAEPDLREEMHSVRTQVAQGLRLTPRWIIDAELGQVSAGNRDAVSYLWQVRRGEETRRIQVFISRTAIASANTGLPSEVALAKDTHGRSAVVTLLALPDPPRQILVTTAGISLTLPD